MNRRGNALQTANESGGRWKPGQVLGDHGIGKGMGKEDARNAMV